MKNQKNMQKMTMRICISGVFMALYIAFCAFSIPVPGGHLYLNDMVICVASIILDPVSAFMVGGVGAFLGDLIFYPLPMFVSLVTHGLQAVVISLISHFALKKHPIGASVIGTSVGAVIMVTGYTLGKIFVYSTYEYAMAKLPYEIAQALLGVFLGLFLCWKCKIVNVAKKQGFYFEPKKKNIKPGR